jgi:hypothetical protein
MSKEPIFVFEIFINFKIDQIFFILFYTILYRATFKNQGIIIVFG